MAFWSFSPARQLLRTFASAVTNHLHDTSYAAFVQDDYKILAGLTLNLGLRYELETLPYEENNQFSNFIPSLGQTVLAAPETPAIDAIIATVPGAQSYITFANNIGYPRTLVYPNRDRLTPRVGFAWRPTSNIKLVIRGGYGIFYTGSRLSVIRTELSGQFPYSIVSNCNPNAAIPPVSTLTNVFTSCGAKYSTVNGYDPHAPSAYIQSYNLTVSKSCLRDWLWRLLIQDPRARTWDGSMTSIRRTRLSAARRRVARRHAIGLTRSITQLISSISTRTHITTQAQ